MYRCMDGSIDRDVLAFFEEASVGNVSEAESNIDTAALASFATGY